LKNDTKTSESLLILRKDSSEPTLFMLVYIKIYSNLNGILIKNNKYKLDVVVYPRNPSTEEAEAGGSPETRHGETLSQKKKKRHNKHLSA
jgi:hypothetical protein